MTAGNANLVWAPKRAGDCSTKLECCLHTSTGRSWRWHQWRGRCKRRLNLIVRVKVSQKNEGQSMEGMLDGHAERLYNLSRHLKAPKKYMVAVAGCPGSGKTTAASLVQKMVNKRAPHFSRTHNAPFASVASMDGFHYYRKELDEMEDPEEAHAKRGAHWTFNASEFVNAVRQLRNQGEALLPSFDHAYGDPIEKDVQIHPETKLVIIEGNYMLLDESPWAQLKTLFDETWFIDCNIDIAMRRVVGRQMKNGSRRSIAEKRVAGNDRPNAELIAKSASRADNILPSIEF